MSNAASDSGTSLTAPMSARTLALILEVAEQSHTRETLSACLKRSRATIARDLVEARRIGADIRWSEAAHQLRLHNPCILPAVRERLRLLYTKLGC